MCLRIGSVPFTPGLFMKSSLSFFSVSIIQIFHRRCIFLELLLLLICSGAFAQMVSPPSGKLMIVGGGETDSLLKKFVDLAGGNKARIVIIPTAGILEEFHDDWELSKKMAGFGALKVTVVHTRNPEVADTEEFCVPLKKATGIWITGGRQWKLVDAYCNTRVVEECFRVLKRGGIIGGTSAGATIQGSYLVRGDTKDNTIMMGDHETGFGFLKNTAIDQHLLARNRQFDLFEVLNKKPELLGIGLDESTAILVERDTFRVIGKSYVAVYDGKFWRRDNNPEVPREKSFYFLREGDKYDLKNRTVVKKQDP